MNIENKIKRIVAKYPHLKDTILSLKEEKVREALKKILEKKQTKYVIVGKNSEETSKLYELAYIVNSGYPHITHITTPELLSTLVGEEGDLTQIKDDLVVIQDSVAYMQHKQKSTLITQVFEQNEQVVYYYKGSSTSFIKEHRALIDYCKSDGICIVSSSSKTLTTPTVSQEEEI